MEDTALIPPTRIRIGDMRDPREIEITIKQLAAIVVQLSEAVQTLNKRLEMIESQAIPASPPPKPLSR